MKKLYHWTPEKLATPKLIELLERAEQSKFIDDIPMTLRVDAAMVEMRTIHPPLRRSECERLIKAALQLPQVAA